MRQEVFELKHGEGRQRADGSSYTRDQNIQGYAAEEWGCLKFGKMPIGKLRGKDPGFDCVVKIDFKYMGYLKDGLKEDACLIVNLFPLNADIYVCVGGSIETGFQFMGWATRREVQMAEKRDFGYGPKFALPIRLLHKDFL